MMQTIPIIDYGTHPAFANLDQRRLEETGILDQMRAIDAALDEAANASEFERRTAEHWRKMLCAVDDAVSESLLRDRAKDALVNAADTMNAFSRWSHKRKRKGTGKRTPQTNTCLEQMETRGAAVMQLPDSVIKRLFNLLEGERAETESRHRIRSNDRCTLHMRCRGTVFDLAWNTLQDQGLVAAVSDHVGREVNPIYFYLAHNSAQETWYQNCYADVGIPTSPFAYAHFDHDFDLAKIQIYLTDVGDENGPFAFVPGSHRWSGCKTQQYVFKEMDKAFKYPKAESMYYRPRFGCPEHRSTFLQLPVPLQGSSHFGDDVLDGTELSRQLHESFHVVTSDQGNCCVFSGGDLLHYGGKVAGADRWVIQFGLAAENPHSAGGSSKRSLFAKLATKSRKYVGNRTISSLRSLLGYGRTKPSQSEYKPNA